MTNNIIALQQQAAHDASIARSFMDSASAQLANGEPVAAVNSLKTAARYQQKSAESYGQARRALDDHIEAALEEGEDSPRSDPPLVSSEN